jgi:hypothetical protein
MLAFTEPGLGTEHGALSIHPERTPPLRDDPRSPSRTFSVQHQVFRI